MWSSTATSDRQPARQGITTVVSRRLGALASLTANDFGILNSLKGRTVPAGTIVHGDPGTPDAPCYILSGWSARLSAGSAGKRQVVTLLLPGDGFGIGASPWAGESLAVCTLTDSVLLDASPIQALVRSHNPDHARLIEACGRASWLEQKYVLDHIVRLGRQNAHQRVLHFVSELLVRLDQVGLTDRGTFSLPVRQQIVADVLGLSCVHFNRIARQMKQEGLVDFVRGSVRVLDRAKLASMAELAWTS